MSQQGAQHTQNFEGEWALQDIPKALPTSPQAKKTAASIAMAQTSVSELEISV